MRYLYIKGLTLLELLVVLAIIAVISMFAIPKMTYQFKKQESQAIKSQLNHFLSQGRQQAIIYQNPITLCMTNQQFQCVSRDGQFLLSFIDKNNNATFEKQTDKLLEQVQLNLKYGHLVIALSLRKNYIQLKAGDGRPIGYMGHIKYCPNDGLTDNMFKVSFSKTGIIKTKMNSEEATHC